jgi:ribonuclease-3
MIGHRFAKHTLLREALTHSSSGGGRRSSNERLEFLGDRVLSLVIADLLIHRFPSDGEGALTPRHAALVAGTTLAQIALELGLGRHLVLGPSEDDAGGRNKPGTLANGLEALIGALYLDGGLAPAAEFIARVWGARLEAMQTPPQAPKSALQEWAQGRGLGLPDYRVVEVAGPAHEPRFEVSVQVGDRPPASATAGSKRAAEQAAAERLLAEILTEGEPSDD